MDYRISIVIVVKVLAIIALHTRQVSCQVNLTGNFQPQDSVIEGTVIILICTVEDRNDGFGATIISGSPAIFDCPSTSFADNNKVFLRHIHMQSATALCGELVSGRIVDVVQNETTSVYIAQINITTTIAMNGGYVNCSELGKNDDQQIQLPNIIALLAPLAVDFPSNDTFVINWHESATQISEYSTSVTGEDCGNCTNLGNVSNVTNQLSCTGWKPNGQVCNVTVTAFTSGLQLSSSRLVYLRTPKAPFLEDIIPVYSYDLEELQSMELLLTVDSTVDPNDLPIMFQVSVERSRSDNMIPKCSFEFSANSKCFANYLAKYRCEINFLVSRCPQLLLQQDQEADYHIRMFAKNSIGNSSLTKTHILSYANLWVQLLFTEPQQFQEDYNFSIKFLQVYAEVASMIEYGPNCQALDNRTTIVGFNVTTLTFSVSIIDKICFIVRINNTFQSLVIQGNFSILSNETSPSSGTPDKDSTFGLLALAIVLLVPIVCYVVLGLIACYELWEKSHACGTIIIAWSLQ